VAKTGENPGENSKRKGRKYKIRQDFEVLIVSLNALPL
jgi:hypothetical protein